ncbi:FecCD family ABC transporter permease [Couchioplanes azureus]|uniref:FecCD family ABC transporter permease n=1 Tax=Couchioplanes caeruleus TaxID=56438 RepID=UPI001670B206|nr:iron chelate uptake ABC transporter family permease subunit [Couchioplanes caeruleus]GGQ63046.1 iron ABC transporter permease [Couchioplanes caeruleus subsp. azureus]
MSAVDLATAGVVRRPGGHLRRRTGGLVLAVVVLAVVVVASLGIGAKDVSAAATWAALWHDDNSTEALVIREFRLPRALLGLLAGAALGLAGALMQALARNPLADPGLLGVNMGASAAVVVAISYLGVSAITGYVWFAFGGAAVASVVVYLLGSAGRAAATPDRLVLAGAAVSAVLIAFTSAVLLLDPNAFNEFRFWNIGSLAGRKLDVVAQIAPFIAAGIALALALARPLNLLALGEQAGHALGAHIGRTRALGALAVALLCGAATAAAGPIGFVGLAVPHLARLLVGPDQRWVLAYSAVLAPILLLGSDVAGRVLIAPAELQVGIVTAFAGAPVFIALCRRRKLAEL